MGEQNLPGQQVAHPSLVKRGAEKKAPPFFKGRCPAKGGTEGSGNKFTKKFHFRQPLSGEAKIGQNFRELNFVMYTNITAISVSGQ